MRVAIFSDNFYPEMSGVTDSITVLAKQLAASGQEVIFFAPQYSAENFKTIGAEVKEIDLGERIKIVRFFSWSYAVANGQGRIVLPTFWRWLKVKKEKIDIIHTQDFFGVGIEALIAAKLLKIPLVGTNHTPITEFLDYSPLKNNLIKKMSLHYVSWYYNRCDYVSTPSQCILDEMKKYGLHSPAQVISNPVELADYFSLPNEAKIKLKNEYKLSDYAILCSGRLAPEKHVDVVIKAVAIARQQVPNINLIITGSGTDKERLQKLVKELNLEKNVKFFGFIESETLVKLYQASDVYAIASTAETQSLSLMKAMAVGMPAIGVNAWALPEYIKENNGFIINPGDKEAMAKKIVLLYNNSALRQRLSEGGKETVKNFYVENIAKKWQEIYAIVIKKRIIA